MAFLLAALVLGEVMLPVRASADEARGAAYAFNHLLERLERDGYECMQYEDSVYLAFKDHENGDRTCYMIVDGELTSEARYERENDRVVQRDLTSKKASKTVVDLKEMRTEVQRTAPESEVCANTDIKAGSIEYRYYMQGWPLEEKLNVSYTSRVYYNMQVNIRGRYQDLATFVTVVASLIYLPSAGAGAVAGTILKRLGIGGTLTNLLIPDLYVRSTEYSMVWKATCGRITGRVIGSKYIVSQAGYENIICYKGGYFPVSAFRNRNLSLAYALHDCMNIYWGDGPYEVIKWKDA